ncbi:YihY/virulence factor BrkB family protein [Dyadobacter sp. CY323]|uniref:YihY/virulence factor BrkB family protein n=1 Tax=Dyadobacter sp. CY323 TaxID=2907302 RepID=UPI001F3C474B|nr:YihY/virulence factor BrkB family protein [Dyadobacter sp. CY323]MCE6991911.1 YihY/virulence factor BrkB family protein [Dyadobacter sp. CY323]
MMRRVKFIISLLKESFSEFSDDNVLKLSAALSYYTIFSIAPMLLLIISIVSIFYGKEAFQGELFAQISGLVGKQAAAQVQELIKNAAITNKSNMAAAIGGVTLLIGATGVFAEIQDSINYIWSIKSKPQHSWLQYLKNRLLSFSIIITLGFLLIVSLGVNALVDVLSNRLERYFSEVSVVIFSVLNVGLVLVIIAALFTVIFKVLPDGHVRWKECLVGASFTSIMFAIGKFAISFYLGQSDLGAAYGTSASIVILLTWIYYSSIILYFGAEFTKVYARSDGIAISPNEHAVLISRRELETTPAAAAAAVAGADAATEKVTSEVKNGIFSHVTQFIDDKLDQIRAEFNAFVAKFASPATYYGIVALIAFCIAITIVLILGQLLNRALDSYYLGYVILIGTTLIILALTLFYRENLQRTLKNILMRFNKE